MLKSNSFFLNSNDNSSCQNWCEMSVRLFVRFEDPMNLPLESWFLPANFDFCEDFLVLEGLSEIWSGRRGSIIFIVGITFGFKFLLFLFLPWLSWFWSSVRKSSEHQVYIQLSISHILNINSSERVVWIQPKTLVV